MTDTLKRLRRIIWEYQGSQLCSAEVGKNIECDLRTDPYGAGIIKELVETARNVRIILTQNRREPIDISASLILIFRRLRRLPQSQSTTFSRGSH
jgi:hypothetical protein